MENHITIKDIISLVEKAHRLTGGIKLVCAECGKEFYKIRFVPKSETDILLIDGNTIYCCDDHILWDLLASPESFEKVLISNRINKTQVSIKKVDAKLFLSSRMN